MCYYHAAQTVILDIKLNVKLNIKTGQSHSGKAVLAAGN